MIINNIQIDRFRGFSNSSFVLGSQVTIIAGQNGTQKTTLLGMISQPFSVTDEDNPIRNEKPLCGGNYKSAFSDKFKLSENFDKAKNHEWTLELNNGVSEVDEYTVESISRDKAKGTIRFWKKGDKNKGSGYLQIPVIYLSLSRLLPIGEDSSLSASDEIILSEEERNFYEEWHNEILIIHDLEIKNIDYLDSKQKNTLGTTTDLYDWKMNSAGQDNIGKILLAILSFKRLQEKYADEYKGGVLAIDEIDATLYPASQLKLLDALKKFASKFKIQIIMTTHSVGLLEKACSLQFSEKMIGQVKVVFLKMLNNKIVINDNIGFNKIRENLDVAIYRDKKIERKIHLYTEDKECKLFFKALIKRKSSKFKFIDIAMGCGNLIQLTADFKIPAFSFPEAMVVLDGDVKEEISKMKKIRKTNNILLLPGKTSPERLLANFIQSIDESLLDKMCEGYNKQIAFRDISFKKIMDKREDAKKWFNSQERYWGREATRIINLWIKNNKEDVDEFLVEFNESLEKFPS